MSSLIVFHTSRGRGTGTTFYVPLSGDHLTLLENRFWAQLCIEGGTFKPPRTRRVACAIKACNRFHGK